MFRVSSVISRLSTEAGRTHFLPPQCFVYRIPGSCRGRFLRKFLGERPGKRAPGSHASEIIVRPQHREQRPNSIQLGAWLCVCRLGCLSFLRRPKSARQVAKIERIEWSKWPFRTALGTPLAGSKSGPEGDVLFICPATFFPGSAARGQGPETRPSVIGACRRGPNSGPISQTLGRTPPTTLCCTAGSPPPPRKEATCNVAVVALQMARTDVLSRALCLVSDGACLRSRASYLLAPFSYPDTR